MPTVKSSKQQSVLNQSLLPLDDYAGFIEGKHSAYYWTPFNEAMSVFAAGASTQLGMQQAAQALVAALARADLFHVRDDNDRLSRLFHMAAFLQEMASGHELRVVTAVETRTLDLSGSSSALDGLGRCNAAMSYNGG